MSGAATTPEPETWTPYRWDSVEHRFDTDGFVVRLKDFPSVMGCGDTREEAFEEMLWAASSCLEAYAHWLAEAEAKLPATEASELIRLPPEDENVLRDNLWDLYEREPEPAGERVSEEERERLQRARDLAASWSAYYEAEGARRTQAIDNFETPTVAAFQEICWAALRTASARPAEHPEGQRRLDEMLDDVANKAAWCLEHGASNENADVCRAIIGYREVTIALNAHGARPADLEALSRDIVADGAWFTAETPSELADRFRAILARHLAPTSDTEAEG